MAIESQQLFERDLSPATLLARKETSMEVRLGALIFSGEPLTALLEAREGQLKFWEALAAWIAFQKLEVFRELLAGTPNGFSRKQLLEWRLWLRLYGSPDTALDLLLVRRIGRLDPDDPWEKAVKQLCESFPSGDLAGFFFDELANQSNTKRLLLAAVLFRQLVQAGLADDATTIAMEYESLSLYASQGRSPDVFGILRSIQRNVQALPPGNFLQRGRKLLSFSHQLGSTLGWGRVGSLLDLRKGNRKLSPAEQQVVFPLLAKTLGDLKGPMMKVGQILSYFATNSDSAVHESLKVLQRNSSPMPYSTVCKQIEKSIKVPMESLFQSFDAVPLGVGSMAQVHRATFRSGQTVAVKVLFPNIGEIVQADLRYLRLASPLVKVMAPHLNFAELLSEMENIFQGECDLRREARMQSRMRAIYAADKDVFVPQVFPEWSTQSVLMMECVSGKNLEEFLKSAPQFERDSAGRTITRFALSSARHGIFNSDPNPGNYLFLDDGRVAFVDFGATVEWNADIAEVWADICRSAVTRDLALFRQALVRGLTTEMPKEKSLHQLFESLAPRDPASWWESGTKEISAPFLAKSMRDHLEMIFSSQHGLKLNPRFIMGLRIYFGHMAVVSKLGAEADWSQLIRGEIMRSSEWTDAKRSELSV